MTTTDRATVLVCAPDDHAEPHVVLANGSYETDRERVFWRSSPDAEVLRIPLQASVAVRTLRSPPSPRVAEDGERRLLAALSPHRRPVVTPRSHDDGALREQLTALLDEGQAGAAEAVARLLWQRTSLAVVHDTMARCLARTAVLWASGRGAVLAERRASTATHRVLERLRDGAEPVNRGRVVLAVPPGEQHTMALLALAHQLQEAGYASLVVDDLPLPELCSLAAEPGTLAVLLSAHVPLPASVARQYLAALHEAAPDVLLVVGGAGLPPGVRGADLVTSDPTELVRALAGRVDPLTQRERDVLLAVAEGLTNSEIADALGVAPATVKTHLDHVFAKTGTEHRAAAVAVALRQGWIC
jgi:DNA-binding CsgD family transcriptional regulator